MVKKFRRVYICVQTIKRKVIMVITEIAIFTINETADKTIRKLAT
jgi:hypothetical protein